MGEVYLNIEGRINQIQTDLKNVQNEMTKLGDKSEQVNKTVREEFESTGEVANNFGRILTGVFSIATITAFIKKLIEVRSEWEKQSAVIKTITGSQLQANNAMKDLRKLADLSTASMKELSDAYIRLAAQGIKPTFDQMKKLMDVAVSANRGFEQLSEAIFDAINQQTKGLKDFRINSKIEGDKIQLSFKGMTETVDLTSEAITGFVLKIAELPGIAGATEEVAKTMSGAVSDIGDAWEHFFEDTSKASEGFLKNLLKMVTGTVNILDVLVKSGLSYKQGEKEQMIIDDLLYAFDKIKAETEALNNENEDLSEGYTTVGERMIELTEDIEKLTIEKNSLNIEDVKGRLELEKRIEDDKIEIEKIKNLTKWLDELAKAEARLRMEREKAITTKKTEAKETPEEIVSTTGMLPDVETLKGYGEDLKAEYNRIMDEIADQDIERTQLTADQKIAIALESLEVMYSYVGLLAARNMAAMDKELKASEGNQKKQEEIRRKYAKKGQQISIIQAIIGGAQTVINALNTQPFFPVGLIMGALAAILVGLQIATIKSQKFAKGVLDLKGKGTNTSDSIPSMLSRGESVMTAKETQEYYPYLKAMKEGKFPKLQLELMNDFAKMKSITNNNLNYDNSKEIRKLEEIRKVLLKEQQYETIEGKFKVIRKGNITTKIALN